MIKYSVEERNFATAERNFAPAKFSGVKYSCEALEVLPSQEGWGTDIAFDGIIGWLLHRKDSELKTAKANVEAAIIRIKEADDSMFHRWQYLKQIDVFSKYLPDWEVTPGTISSLKKACEYLKSIKKTSQFNQDKFEKLFAGSAYIKGGKFSDDEVTGTGFWNLVTTDIRLRGWYKKDRFLTALKGAKELIPMAEAVAEASEDVKLEDGSKEYKKAVKTVITLVGFYCRGIASVSNKIGGSVWKRLFTTES
jgi:hypothetical protein